jgi:hypothetical protein
MLFVGGIHSVFYKQLHGLATTNKLSLSAMKTFYNVPEQFTLVDL